MTIFARVRRLLGMAASADADAVLERLLTESDLRLTEARGDIQLCAAQETRLELLRDDEARRAALALSDARRALAAGRQDVARQAAARHVRAGQLAGIYDAQLAQLRDSRRRLEALAETMAMKLAVLEQQQQVLHARHQLAQAQQALARGLHRGDAGQLEQLEEQWLTEELTTEAYQELVNEELPEPGDPVEGVLDRLRATMPALRDAQQEEM